MRIDRDRKRQCVHGCGTRIGETMNKMMRFLLDKEHARSIVVLHPIAMFRFFPPLARVILTYTNRFGFAAYRPYLLDVTEVTS